MDGWMDGCTSTYLLCKIIPKKERMTNQHIYNGLSELF